MLKGLKKTISLIAGLSMLTASFQVAMAAPDTRIDWNMDDKEAPNTNCKYVQSGKNADTVYANGMYGKDDTDFCVQLAAANNTYFDIGPKGSVQYTDTGYGEGTTVHCSVDFAFEKEGKMPTLQVAGSRDTLSGTTNLYADAANLNIELNTLPTIEAKKWHTLDFVIKINGNAKSTLNDVTIWVDGTLAGSGKVAANNALGYVWTLFRVTNPSTDGENTMYLDNELARIYPPKETVKTVNYNPIASDVLNFEMPYTTTLIGATKAYKTENDDVVLELDAAATGKYIQWQDISAVAEAAAGKTVEFSFDAKLSEVTGGMKVQARTSTNGAYDGQQGLNDSTGTQSSEIYINNGKINFYGIETDQEIKANEWYSYKVVYDIVESKKVIATLYVENEKVTSGIFTTNGAINGWGYIRFITQTANSPIYLDDIDITVSDYVAPSVSAAAGNVENDGVKYMTFDAAPANVAADEIDECGFAFINTNLIADEDPIVWQVCDMREDGSFGAAIAQEEEATSSTIYAVPYIVVDLVKTLGEAVQSVFVD